MGTISIELVPLSDATSRISSAKLLAAALLVTSGSLIAETIPERGPSLIVSVAVEGRGAAECGVQTESLKSIAGFVLNSTKISRVGVGVDPSANILDIRGLVISQAKSCFASLSVDIIGFSPDDLKKLPLNRFTSKFRKTVLCSTGSLVVGPTADFPGRLSNSLEQDLKECLGGLKY